MTTIFSYVARFTLAAIAAGAGFVLFVYNAPIEEAKAAVLKTLKDPDSARFTDIKHVYMPGGGWVCGRVNAKNGFGGYDGPKVFLYYISNQTLRTEANPNETNLVG